MRAWNDPDPTAEPIATLDAKLPVIVVRRTGDWAQVRCSNDWTGWVDGRWLVSTGAEPELAPALPPSAEPAASTGALTSSGGAVTSYADLYRRAHQSGRSPAAIAAEASAEAGQARTPLTPALAGAVLVGVGAFLPWFSFPGSPSRGTPSIPLQFLVDIRTTATGPIDLVVPLLVAAAFGVAGTLLPNRARLRRIAGWSVVVLTSVFVGQLQRLLNDFGPGGPGLTDAAGFGVLATLAGGLLLALAPERTKPEGSAS